MWNWNLENFTSGWRIRNVKELLKRRSVMFQRFRRSLLSDGVEAGCSIITHVIIQWLQMVNSWYRSLRNSGLTMNKDLVVRRVPSDSATRLHITLVGRFRASDNYKTDVRYDTIRHKLIYSSCSTHGTKNKNIYKEETPVKRQSPLSPVQFRDP